MTVLRATALSHTGKVRRNNQDSAIAGQYLFAVADGMGGHAGGDIASALTVQSLVDLDRRFDTVDEAAQAIELALRRANATLSETVADYPELTGMGTTFSGFLAVGDSAVIAHIGDSRIYRWRDGELTQLTKDHTFVQRLVDAGRITPEEALVHPRRSVIMRVLGDIEANPDIDVFTEQIDPGDRLLICSDGLSGPVGDEAIAKTLARGDSADMTCAHLLEIALRNGAPDNCTVVLVEPDADPDATPHGTPGHPVIVGAAAREVRFDHLERIRTQKAQSLHALREAASHLKPRRLEPTQFESQADEYLDELIAETRRRTVLRRVVVSVLSVLIIGGIALGAWLGWRWTQTQYYIGEDAGYAVIYQGVNQQVGPFKLSHTVDDSRLPQIPMSDLDELTQQQVRETVAFPSLDAAASRLGELNSEHRRRDSTEQPQSTPSPQPDDGTGPVSVAEPDETPLTAHPDGTSDAQRGSASPRATTNGAAQ